MKKKIFKIPVQLLRKSCFLLFASSVQFNMHLCKPHVNKRWQSSGRRLAHNEQWVSGNRSCHLVVWLMECNTAVRKCRCSAAFRGSVCSRLSQLTLICLISNSKSLSSAHANKHIQPFFKTKLLSNTCLISWEPMRQFIMHLKEVPWPCLAAQELWVAGLYVITGTLTFSNGWQLPP